MASNRTEEGVNPNRAGISVLLPAWNEGENLVRLAEAILQFPEVTELIVIDDASGDGTPELWRNCSSAGDPRVKFHRNEKRLGLACSVFQASRLATQSFLLVRDSDWNHDLATMREFFRELSAGRDFVIASRYSTGAMPVGRWNDFLSISLNKFLSLLHSGISDWTYGYFFLRRDFLEGAPLEWIFRGRGEYSLRLYRWLNVRYPTLKPLMVPTVVQKRGAGQSSTRSLKHGLAYLYAFLDPVPKSADTGIALKSAMKLWSRRGDGVAVCGHSRMGLRSRLALFNKERPSVQGSVLDLGCGNGAFSRLAFPDLSIIDGVDQSRDLLVEASKHYRQVWEGDLRQGIPKVLKGKTYDTILCLELIQYLSWEEVLTLFKDTYLHAHPGTSLHCLFPNRASLWHRIRHALGVGREDYFSRHDASLVVEAAQEAGWKIRSAWGCSYGSETPVEIEAFPLASLAHAHFLLRFEA